MKPLLLSISLLLSVPAWAQNPVTIRVFDDKRAPVAGANIEVQIWRDRDKPIAPQVTGADGAATFEIPAENGKSLAGGFSVVAKGFAFNNGALKEKSVDISLQPGATWRGKVTDEAGKPIAGAVVRVTSAMKPAEFFNRLSLLGEKNRKAYTAISGADGSFSIADVPAAMLLQFTVSHPDYALKNSGVLGVNDEAILKLAPGGALKGRVLDLAGKPIAGAAVSVYSTQRGGGNVGKTDANGVYTVPSLAAGEYVVNAALVSEWGQVPAGRAPFLFPNATARVEAGKTLNAPDIRAVKGVLIEGTVRDAETKKPLANASVIAQAKEETDGYDTSDATGHFQLRVTPGTYRVYISGPPFGYARPDAQKTVDSTKNEGVVFDLKKARILRGKIVDEAGKLLQAKISLGHRAFPGSGIESGADGKWQYQPQDERKLQLSGGDDEDGYFEIVAPLSIDPSTQGETTITMRKIPWQVLPGRALTTDGKPLEGVQIQGSFSTPIGESNMLNSSQRTATTNANGDFILPQIRDGIRAGSNYFQISGKKAGYAFQKGGELSKNGPVWQVTDFIFAPLNSVIEGTTAPGARVTVAGLETVAGADGRFKFEGLPATDSKIWAFKGGDFGGGEAKAPLSIPLKPQTLQARDETLAREIWNDIIVETKRDPKGKSSDTSGWAERRLAPDRDDFAAQFAKANDDISYYRIIEHFSGKVEPSQLEPAITRTKNEDWRTSLYLTTALKLGDKAMSERALLAAEANFKTPEDRVFSRESNQYFAAAIAAQVRGEAAGLSMLDRAMAYTLKNHPEESVVVQANEVTTGRNDVFSRQAEFVAEGGAALVRRLLEQVDEETGHRAAVLGAAIPVLAKNGGAESVLPLLDELEKTPEAVRRGERFTMGQSAQWAFGEAVIKVVPLLGAKSPQKALELALRVKSDDNGGGHRAQALALAAPFQHPNEAAKLWREAVRDATATQAPRMAARAWEFDPKLGRELFEIARQKVESESQNEWQGSKLWAGFAFYFARADAAQARFLIEQKWGAARQKKTDGDELIALALAMSAIDGPRAWQMAREIPEDNFSAPFTARRRIGLFLAASEEVRRDFPFNRNDNYEEWRKMEEG